MPRSPRARLTAPAPNRFRFACSAKLPAWHRARRFMWALNSRSSRTGTPTGKTRATPAPAPASFGSCPPASLPATSSGPRRAVSPSARSPTSATRIRLSCSASSPFRHRKQLAAASLWKPRRAGWCARKAAFRKTQRSNSRCRLRHRQPPAVRTGRSSTPHSNAFPRPPTGRPCMNVGATSWSRASRFRPR